MITGLNRETCVAPLTLAFPTAPSPPYPPRYLDEFLVVHEQNGSSTAQGGRPLVEYPDQVSSFRGVEDISHGKRETNHLVYLLTKQLNERWGCPWSELPSSRATALSSSTVMI